MMRARSNFQIPGMSCPREIRPLPMAPTLIRLPGAVAPKTEEGTMAGNPAARTDVPPIPRAAIPSSFRRDISLRFLSAMAPSLRSLRFGDSGPRLIAARALRLVEGSVGRRQHGLPRFVG